jgi:hypothetical protein
MALSPAGSGSYWKTRSGTSDRVETADAAVPVRSSAAPAAATTNPARARCRTRRWLDPESIGEA